MISGLAQILLFQGLGETLSRLLLPSIPGPVLGLVLLIGFLVIRRRINADLESVAMAFSAIRMPYAKYFEGAQFGHFLLGTATVSLAVPVYHGLRALRGRVLALGAAIVAGAVTSVVSAITIARLLGADRFITGGLYAKSLTTPIAMGVAERIGASPTLTAVYALITGVLGAVLGRYVLDAVGCRVWWQRGFVIGIAAHGIGTSRAFAVHPEAGAYASLAMGLHGIFAAVLLPWIVGSI